MNSSMPTYSFPAILLILAFLCSFMPVHDYQLESFGLAFLLASFAFFAQLLDHRRGAAKDLLLQPLSLLGFAFWALAFISICLSEVRSVSFLYFCFFSVLPLGYLTSVLAYKNPVYFKTIYYGFMAVFLLVGLSCLGQFFIWQDYLLFGRVTWPLANPNALAGLLSLGTFGALGLMLAGENRWQRNLALVAAILIFCAFLTTGSRAALICFVLAMAVFLMLNPGQLKKHARCFAAFLAVSVTFFAAMHFYVDAQAAQGGAAGVTSFGTMLYDGFSGQKSFLWDRPAIWAASWEMIKDHFWFGTGIGTFFLYYPEYRAEDLNTAGFMAHSDPIQFWVEMGVGAIVLFYIIQIWVIGISFRKLFKGPDISGVGESQISSEVEWRRVVLSLIFCAFGALIVHTHFSFHFYILPTLLLSGIGLGCWQILVLGRSSSVDTGGQVLQLNLRQKQGAGFVLFVWLLVLGGFLSLLMSEIFLQRAQRHIQEDSLQAYAIAVNAASDLSLGQNARAYLMAAALPIGILEEGAGDNAKSDYQEQYERAKMLLDQAERYNPRLVGIPYYRARLVRASEARRLKIEDDVDNPEAYAKEALRLNPQHIGSRLFLADLYIDDGARDKALDVLKEGMKWEYVQQDPREFYQKIGWLALELGDFDLHDQAIKAYGQRHLTHLRAQGYLSSMYVK